MTTRPTAVCIVRVALVATLVSVVSPVLAAAQTPSLTPSMTFIHDFANDGIPNHGPRGALVQASDLNFYGVTERGGTAGVGTLFRMTPAGAVTILHSFVGGEDGALPLDGVIQGRDGFLYGTTEYGGSANLGTVFRATLDGAVTMLHSFDGGAEGARPTAALVQSRDGNYYGTTKYGGSAGRGTVFRLTTIGTITTVHSFQPGEASQPSGLIEGLDGRFFGSSRAGGTSNHGTVFRIASDGTYTTLHSFPGGAGGTFPVGGVIQAIDGNFYGAVQFYSLDFQQYVSSGIYRVGPGDAFTIVNSSIQQQISGSLIATTDEYLWGAVEGWAPPSCEFPCGDRGYLFLMNFKTGVVYDTRNVSQGFNLATGLINTLVQGRDGNLYGTTTGLNAFWSDSPKAFRLTNYARCIDKLTMSYEGTTLNLGLTVGTTEPATWSAWLALPGPPEERVLLWQTPIPVVRPAAFVNLAVPNFPPVGPLFFISNLTLPNGRFCADWKLIDTGP
jgi:uncharacterized repeat protein (TIGR03803 family)